MLGQNIPKFIAYREKAIFNFVSLLCRKGAIEDHHHRTLRELDTARNMGELVPALVPALGSLLLADSKPLFNILAERFVQEDCVSLFDSLFAEFGVAEGSVTCDTCDVTFSNHPPATWMADILATASCTVANGGPSGTFYIGKQRLPYFLAAFDYGYLLTLFDLAGRYSGTVGFGAAGSFSTGDTTTTCEILMEAENVRNLGQSGQSAEAGAFQPVAQFRPIPDFSDEGRTSGLLGGNRNRNAEPSCKVSNGVDCALLDIVGNGFDTSIAFDCAGEALFVNPFMIPN